MPAPWANLSAKFQDVIDALNSLVAGQADLLTAQNSTNAKLDSILNAITGLQGSGNRTLTDLYDKTITVDNTALENLLTNGLFSQGDLQIPYMLQVRNSLVAQDGDLTDLRTAIWGLAGPAPGVTLTDIQATLIDALYSQTTPSIPYLLQLRGALGLPPATNAESVQQQLLNFVDTFGDRGAGLDFYDLTDQININLAGIAQAIGSPTGDATTNVLGRLIAIANATKCACEALSSCTVYTATSVVDTENECTVWCLQLPGSTPIGDTPWVIAGDDIQNRSFRFLTGNPQARTNDCTGYPIAEVNGPGYYWRYPSIDLNTWYHFSQSMEDWALTGRSGEFTIEVCASVKPGSVDLSNEGGS